MNIQKATKKQKTGESKPALKRPQKAFASATPTYQKQSPRGGCWKTSVRVPSLGQSARSPWGQTWKSVHVQSDWDCACILFIYKRNMKARVGIMASITYHSVVEEHREHQNKNTAGVETRPCNMTRNQNQQQTTLSAFWLLKGTLRI